MAIAPINLGSFYTNSNGTSVSNGISSGLNTQSVIASLTAGQSSQITSLQDQIKVNNTQSTALGSLQQILSSLQSAASALSNPNSPDTINNLWAVRTSQINSNTTQPASNYLTATVASGTPTGTYTITNIGTLAQATVQESGTFSSITTSVVAASSTPGEFTAGTLTIENPNGTTSANVTLNAGDNLSQVANDFNAVKATTGITASVVQTSPGVYTLVFQSNTTGANTNFDLGSTGTVTSNQTLLSNISFTTVETGQDAQFMLNNVAIDRPTNTVSDLITGVTINLLQNTSGAPGASFTLQVAPDTNSIQEGIDAFATAYNNFINFYAQQTQTDSSGAPLSSSILFSDATLRNIYTTLSNEVAGIVPGIASGAPASLAAVGITLTQPTNATSGAVTPNILSVDNSTLLSELQSNFSGVENVFGYNLVSSDPNLALFQSSDLQTVQNFSVSITQSTNPPVYTATYGPTAAPTTVSLSAVTLSSGGVALTGPAGSAIDGLQLIYTSSGDNLNISVSTSQGFADAINNEITAALKPNTGLIANDQTLINTKNTSIQTQITAQTTQLNNTRAALQQKYATLEAAISAANSTLGLLNANQVAQSSAG
jgi:flagellar hook-associated protein 2